MRLQRIRYTGHATNNNYNNTLLKMCLFDVGTPQHIVKLTYFSSAVSVFGLFVRCLSPPSSGRLIAVDRARKLRRSLQIFQRTWGERSQSNRIDSVQFMLPSYSKWLQTLQYILHTDGLDDQADANRMFTFWNDSPSKSCFYLNNRKRKKHVIFIPNSMKIPIQFHRLQTKLHK